ncbi:hypothetical protein [Candidatus Villigracilis vicinus]|uniref:hypothetical protein n=1 Tax=Candidatus Villigracilis vicinus TaxID=3140679 RepID=UPI0031F06BBA
MKTSATFNRSSDPDSPRSAGSKPSLTNLIKSSPVAPYPHSTPNPASDTAAEMIGLYFSRVAFASSSRRISKSS